MTRDQSSQTFADINTAFNSVFKPGRLSLGVTVPLESYGFDAVPKLPGHLERVQLSESLGFSAVWIRDVPFNVTSFGDAGQTFDPFVYLGYLAAHTTSVALGVASVILPLRHPAHVAKAAASVDVLSGGRMLMGIASGDRPDEYPAMDVPFEHRGKRFRDSYTYIRKMAQSYPPMENPRGNTHAAMDLLPKPFGSRIPLLITGGSQQDPAWIAENGDGWMTYPRNSESQSQLVENYRFKCLDMVGQIKPVMQPLHIDLINDDNAPAQPIHLGFRSGVSALVHYLKSLETAGVNHVALNLRFNQADIEETMKRLSAEVLPLFN